MKYTLKPAIVEGCQCEECRAGRHLYYLYRCSNLESGYWSSMSLHTYESAQEAKENHYWGIAFGPDDTWEDGSPIRQPDLLAEMRAAGRTDRGMVPLNVEVLKKSTEMLEKHWVSGDSTA